MRNLAHIEEVVRVFPIPGADAIEGVQVLGWECVIKKGELKAGDKCVYIEIDSIVPAIPMFEFLKDRKYRIKTIKLRGQLSQGLALPITDEVRNLIGHGDQPVGKDVTDMMKIEKYLRPSEREEDEDDTPLPKSGMGRVAKFLYRWAWFRWLYGKVYPKPSKGFPGWVGKTDEERIQANPNRYLSAQGPLYVSEKVDGCLGSDMRIKTNLGVFRIGSIVNKKMDVLVQSYNQELKIVEMKPIVEYHKIKANRDTYKIGCGHRGKGNRKKFVECTDNHKFFTDSGWVEAKDLRVGDTIYHFAETVPYETKQVILGCLLGDSSVTSKKRNNSAYRSVFFSHSIEQSDYFEYKKKMLGPFFIEQEGKKGGYPGSKPNRRGILSASLWMHNLIYDFCLVADKKHVTKEWANEIGPIALAFWYMDDGSISNRNVENFNCRAMFNTQGFSYEENEILQKMLHDKFGITATIGDKKTYKGYVLRLDVDDTEKLASIILPYVPKSMKYKLPKKYEEIPCIYENASFDFVGGVLPTKVLSVEKGEPDQFGKYVYDLEIADNHNYFAHGILVHNCSHTSVIERRRGLLKKHEFVVCSRNNRMGVGSKGSWRWVAEHENHESKMLDMLEDYPEVQRIAIQGENIGPGIQKNRYKREEYECYVFNIKFYKDGKTYPVGLEEMVGICNKYGFKHVPILDKNFEMRESLPLMLEYADGKSVLADTIREGVVIRSHDQTLSFKVVSNRFLLKGGEDE